MRLLFACAVALIAAACADTVAAPQAKLATACLDVSGSQEVVECVKHGSVYFAKDEGFCSCPTPAREVKATPCAPGQRPPAENAEYREALLTASRDGSLVGDTFHGQAICIPPATP